MIIVLTLLVINIILYFACTPIRQVLTMSLAVLSSITLIVLLDKIVDVAGIDILPLLVFIVLIICGAVVIWAIIKHTSSRNYMDDDDKQDNNHWTL